MLCYVAVCNNHAICNTKQTTLNCNAVCNKSYFKLRCEGNAICNVLQIASKFYHLKNLNRRKNWSTTKCIASIISYYEFREIPIYSNSQSTLHLVRTLRYFVPSLFGNKGGGALKPIRPSVYWFVCPSFVCHKNFNLAHIFWRIKDMTLMFGMNGPWKKSF